MQASMCSYKLLLYFLIGASTVSIFRGTKMAIEGLPFHRQEPDSNQDILAGADFLSFLMESSLRRAYAETTSAIPPTTIFDYTTKRDKRNSNDIDFNSENSPTTFSNIHTERLSVSDSNTDKDGVVVAARVSSSAGEIVDDLYERPTATDTPCNQEATTDKPSKDYFDSENRPRLVAEASKSELSVEESEPITKDGDLAPGLSEIYPARVLPQFHRTATFLNRNLPHTNEQPYGPTVIYHDNSGDTNSARSVSYSSIVQLPQIPIVAEKSAPHERHERNYNNAKIPFTNTFDTGDNKRKENDTRALNWPKSEQIQKTTEKPWENRRRYTPTMTTTTPLPVELPKVYGQPEQNYEVDEELSVVTNGRAHGIQPTKPEKKPDDDQKFGYVVEGKNYRKYRVEERTADGFIVGEYGVVSHDDGSLRGVRYTADGTISPRLISEALMKFLSL